MKILKYFVSFLFLFPGASSSLAGNGSGTVLSVLNKTAYTEVRVVSDVYRRTTARLSVADSDGVDIRLGEDVVRVVNEENEVISYSHSLIIKPE